MGPHRTGAEQKPIRDPRLDKAIFEGAIENKKRREEDIETLSNWVNTTLFQEIKEAAAQGRNNLSIKGLSLPRTKVMGYEKDLALQFVATYIKEHIAGIVIERHSDPRIPFRLEWINLTWRKD